MSMKKILRYTSNNAVNLKYYDSYGRNALYYACRYSSINIVKLLIRKKKNKLRTRRLLWQNTNSYCLSMFHIRHY